MKHKIADFLSRFSWTRYRTAEYYGTEYEYETYFGFYIRYSPCSVGFYHRLAWHRRKTLILDLGFTEFSWQIAV